jgi:hypothetical protein
VQKAALICFSDGLVAYYITKLANCNNYGWVFKWRIKNENLYVHNFSSTFEILNVQNYLAIGGNFIDRNVCGHSTEFFNRIIDEVHKKSNQKL